MKRKKNRRKCQLSKISEKIEEMKDLNTDGHLIRVCRECYSQLR